MSRCCLFISSVIFLLVISANSFKLKDDILVSDSLNDDPTEVDIFRNQVAASRLRNYITNLLLSPSVREVMWYFLKFIVCNMVSATMACGVMNVLSDEAEGDSSRTPEDIARGLRFMDDIIEIYHNAQKRAV